MVCFSMAYLNNGLFNSTAGGLQSFFGQGYGYEYHSSIQPSLSINRLIFIQLSLLLSLLLLLLFSLSLLLFLLLLILWLSSIILLLSRREAGCGTRIFQGLFHWYSLTLICTLTTLIPIWLYTICYDMMWCRSILHYDACCYICMNVCMYTYICICICICVYIYIYIYMYPRYPYPHYLYTRDLPLVYPYSHILTGR